jgi:glycosyltransferase involved in cell wall biosynthesis
MSADEGSSPRGRPELALIVPVFEERGAIPSFFEAVVSVLDSLGCSWEIVVVDDGSSDGSAGAARAARPFDHRVVVVELARNFGKEAAVCAGMDVADADAVVVIDVDLQDPPELIPEFVRLWRSGADIVYGARRTRAGDSFLKRTTAAGFYRLFNRLADVKIPADAGDFRLMDRQVVDVLRLLPERSRFMKGLFTWPGFTVVPVPYDRPPRKAGRSGWSYRKLWTYGLDGVFNFSSVPLRLWTYVGATIVALGLVFTGIVIVQTLFFGNEVKGYPSLISLLTVLGGIQIAGIGLVGEYLSRVFLESKSRPLYVVRSADRVPDEQLLSRYPHRNELDTFGFRRAGPVADGYET